MRFIIGTGLLLMIMVFGLGFFMAWIGWRGTGFAATDGQKEITELQYGATLERTPIGSNIIKYRGLKLEVYRKVEKFPVLKLRIGKKTYYDTIIPYCNQWTATYQPAEKMLLVNCESFSDTVKLDR